MSLLGWGHDDQSDQQHNHQHQTNGGWSDQQQQSSDPRYLGPPIHDGSGSSQQGHSVGFQQPKPEPHDDLPKHPDASQIGFSPVSQMPPGQINSQQHRQDEEHKSDSGLEHQHHFGGTGVTTGDQHPPQWIGPPVHDGGQNQPGSYAGNGYNPANPHPAHNPIPTSGAGFGGGQHSENDIAGATHHAKDSDSSWKDRHHGGRNQPTNNPVVGGIAFSADNFHIDGPGDPATGAWTNQVKPNDSLGTGPVDKIQN